MTQSAGDKAETVEVMEHRAASKEANEDASPQVSWMENSQVFKGDDSDGRITWNPRTIVAAVSLAGMYTGKLCWRVWHQVPELTSSSLSNHPLLRLRNSRTYHHDRWWCRGPWVDPYCLPDRPRRHSTLRGLSPGPIWPSQHWNRGTGAAVP